MIISFSGQWRFLSNFHECAVMLDGAGFPTVENAYQAAKTLNVTERHVFRLITAGQAKRAGRTVTLRPDWEEVKLQIMYDLLLQKFSTEPFRSKLLSTGHDELVEGNYWNDRFWGQCPVGVGENWLGQLLMVIREVVR